MKIDNLRLINFRQYYGEQAIRFAPDGPRNVTVINGNNGAGKTSLFLALNWCLYGDKAIDTPIGELTNKRALFEAAPNVEVQTQVQLRFRHKAMRYVATRTLVQYKVDSSSWKALGKSDFVLLRVKSGGAAEQVANPEAVIETLLPSNVRSYFFFDGEKIERFSSPGHETDVKEAIRNVLQIEVLERAKEHLDVVAKEYQKELKAQATGKLQEVLVEEERTRSTLDQAKIKLSGLLDEERAAKRLLQELEERLVDVKAVSDSVELRHDLEEQQKAREAEYEQLQIQLRGEVSRGYVVLAGRVCDQAIELLDQKRKRGQIPSGVREVLIRDLLTSRQCICGRDVAPHSRAEAELQSLLERAVSSELEDFVSQLTSSLVAVNGQAGRFPVDLRNRLEACRKTEGELERLHDQIERISEKLKDSPLEQVVGLERRRQEEAQKREQLVGDTAVTRDRIERLQQELKGLEDRRETVKQQERKSEAIYAKYQLARKAADKVESIFEDFASSMRRAIQTEARTIFQSLISKATQFSDIRLTDDYRLEVLDRWGYAARLEMSAGERQVLSLSFIAGMAKISGMESPLVMDTPFGRLYSVHRENIVEHLPDLTGQLALFVQDEELHGAARRKLEPRIGVEYSLEFDHATGCTRIVEVTQ